MLASIPDWYAMFVPSNSLVEIFLRGSICYLALLLVFRVSLNRQAGNVGLPDILLVVLVADATQNGMAGEYRSITEGLLLVGTLVFWNYVIDWATYRFPVLRRWLHPSPLLLIRRGKIVEENLAREYVTRDELMSQLRLEGVKNLAEVETAQVEPCGKVSVIKAEPSEEGSAR